MLDQFNTKPLCEPITDPAAAFHQARLDAEASRQEAHLAQQRIVSRLHNLRLWLIGETQIVEGMLVDAANKLEAMNKEAQ